MGQLVGAEAAQLLGVPFGIVDLSLAPTPAVGDSVAYILEEIGLEKCGAHGTTATLALLNDAVKKGGVMASSKVGGLSGGFPVENVSFERDIGAVGRIIKDTRNTDITFALYDNGLLANPNRRYNADIELVKQVDRRIYTEPQSETRYPYYYYINPGYFSHLLPKKQDAFEKMGLKRYG